MIRNSPVRPMAGAESNAETSLKAERIQLTMIIELIPPESKRTEEAAERHRRIEDGYRRRTAGDYWSRPADD